MSWSRWPAPWRGQKSRVTAPCRALLTGRRPASCRVLSLGFGPKQYPPCKDPLEGCFLRGLEDNLHGECELAQKPRIPSERGLPDAVALGSVKLHDVDVAIHPVPSHMGTGTHGTPARCSARWAELGKHATAVPGTQPRGKTDMKISPSNGLRGVTGQGSARALQGPNEGGGNRRSSAERS